MRPIAGVCPHCGAAAQCGLLENKLSVNCPVCRKPLFDRIAPKLKMVNILFLFPLVPPLLGVALRRKIGIWPCAALIAAGAVLLFCVLLLERHFCIQALKGAPKKP